LFITESDKLAEIHKELEAHGTLFQTTSDTEYIIHLFAHAEGATIEDKLLAAFRRLKGAFSILVLFDDKMIVAATGVVTDRSALVP
jgi:amidophosphoribosyltransferase